MKLVTDSARLARHLMTALLITALLSTILLAGCGESPVKSRAVYMLVDTSGTYTEQLDKAETSMNYLLATLDSGDSLALARIDSASFNEEDIIAKATFDVRPSTTNDQKRLFQHHVQTFTSELVSGSAQTDITGGILQAIDFLNETDADEKTILVFSDLEEDLPEGHVRDFPIDVAGIEVVALNVTKLTRDNIDPRDYENRLNTWQKRVMEGGGQWRVINDLERLDRLVAMN